MDINSLQQLRTEVINRAQTLALEGQVNDEDKLAVLMNLIRTGAASDRVVRSAFEVIDQLPDDDTKLSTYLDLLYEIDQMIARSNAPVSNQQAEETPLQTEQERQSDDNFQG